MMLCLQQSGIVIVADVPESDQRKRDGNNLNMIITE